MTPNELVLYIEALAGHFVLGAIGFLFLMMAKDFASAIVKSIRWRTAMGLKEGDRVMLDGKLAIVSSINLTAVSFTLINGGVTLRTVSIERAAYIKIEKVIVPDDELHGLQEHKKEK